MTWTNTPIATWLLLASCTISALVLFAKALLDDTLMLALLVLPVMICLLMITQAGGASKVSPPDDKSNTPIV